MGELGNLDVLVTEVDDLLTVLDDLRSRVADAAELRADREDSEDEDRNEDSKALDCLHDAAHLAEALHVMASDMLDELLSAREHLS